jgi:hypothetical protein
LGGRFSRLAAFGAAARGAVLPAAERAAGAAVFAFGRAAVALRAVVVRLVVFREAVLAAVLRARDRDAAVAFRAVFAFFTVRRRVAAEAVFFFAAFADRRPRVGAAFRVRAVAALLERVDFRAAVFAAFARADFLFAMAILSGLP